MLNPVRIWVLALTNKGRNYRQPGHQVIPGMTVGEWWDETDILSYLEVVPDHDEEYYSYEYNVERNGMHLRLTIAPYDAYVHFEIGRGTEDPPLFELPQVKARLQSYMVE